MSAQQPIEQQIDRAVEILRKGGLVAYPTDTVYGLGADPSSETAVANIYEVKIRSRNLPLPLLLAEKGDLSKVAVDISDLAWKLVERFLPGGLTLVLKKSARVSGTVTAGGNTVAVRIPDHQITSALIRRLGNPIVGTSANVSGKPSPVTADEVHEQLGDGVDLIIDGGRCPGGVESTVVDVSGEIPVLLREGAVSRHELSELCGSVLQGK